MAENNEKTTIGESENRNEVKIAGQVVNIFQFTNKDITNTTITTTAGENRNNPKITWHGEDSRKVAGILKGKTNPNVSITGYVQTSRKTRNGKVEYHQNIVGKTLTVNTIPKSENEVYITGELAHKYNRVKKSTGERYSTRIRVKADAKKHNYPEITLFGEQSEKAQTIELGSTVSIIGIVQTEKKTDPATGKTLFLTSIVGLRLYT